MTEVNASVGARAKKDPITWFTVISGRPALRLQASKNSKKGHSAIARQLLTISKKRK
jgi:hypothetical protein